MIDDAFVKEIVDSIKLNEGVVYVISCKSTGAISLYKGKLPAFRKWIKESLVTLLGDCEMQMRKENDRFVIKSDKGHVARIRGVDLDTFLCALDEVVK